MTIKKGVSEVAGFNTHVWQKRWSRGMKVQRAISYAFATGDPFKSFFGRGVYFWLYISRGETLDWCVDRKEWELFLNYIRRRRINNPAFYKQFGQSFFDPYTSHLNLLEQIAKKNKILQNSSRLIKAYKKVRASAAFFGARLWIIVVMEELIKDFLQEALKPFPKKKRLAISKILLSVDQVIYLVKEEQELSRILSAPTAMQPQLLRSHTKKWGFISKYDIDYPSYPLSFFKKRLHDLRKDVNAQVAIAAKLASIKKNEKNFTELLKNEHLSQNDKLKLRAVHFIANHKDQRSYYRSKDCALSIPLYEAIAKKLELSFKNVQYLQDEEIIEGLEKKLSKKELLWRVRQRKVGYRMYALKKRINIVVNNKPQVTIIKKEQTVVINGKSAFPGILRGIVKIVYKSKDIKKVSSGDILVSTMTRPDYLMWMKKAAAFVTDEGGILSHAAIVARELKKPCIIGTKNATKVLKDGDFVEVDADEGVVKILKKLSKKK
jgi:phosphohistidine swiveling domain-containing protein